MANPARSFELIRLWPGLSADPGTGKPGEIYYNSTTQSLKYYDGSVWKDFGGTWANQQLSNLIGPTAINQDLLPDTDLSRSVGSASLRWNQAYISNLLKVGQVTADDLANMLINTTDATGANASGALAMQTGNTEDGPSGSITIQTGVPSGGTSVFDQQNTAFSDVVFQYDTSALGVNQAGVQIVAGANGTLSSIIFKLQNDTATDDTFITQVYVYSDNAGQPGTLISQSSPVPVTLLGNATADQSYTFSSPVFVTSGQTYYFILTAQATASVLNLLGSSTDVGTDGWASSTDSGGSWTVATQPDPYFILYNAPARGNIDLGANAVRFLNSMAARWYDSDSSNYVGFKAAGSLSADTIWTLPTSDGTPGQLLGTDGSGQLSWTTVSLTPDFSDAAFRIHSNTDATKLLAFNVTSIASSTTRTWTVPDANLNFALGGGSFVARAGDTMTGALNTQALIPTTTAAYDLGSNALYFRDIYANDLVRQAQVLVGNGGTTLPSGVSQAYGLNDLNIGSLGTMAVWSQSNNAANATATGTVRLETGNKTAGTGNSGDIKLRIGTSSGGTRGSLYIADGSEGTIGQVWTSTDATGKGHWAAIPAGANQALSNLTATSINQDLVPQSGYMSLFSTASGSNQNYALPDNGTRYAQKFTPTSSGSVAKMDLHVYAYQQPTGNVKIGIYTDGTTPGTLLGYSNDIDVSAIPAFSTGQLITAIFPASIPIVSGTTYWWSIETSTGFGGRIGSEGAAVGSGPNAQSAWNGSSWSAPGFLQNATSYYVMYSLAGHSLGSLAAPWDELFTSKLSVVSGSNKLSFIAPTLSGNTTWTLPSGDGSANQFLQTNGSGVLSWGTVSVAPSSIASVRASTTGNINLASAPSSFDGVSPSNGDLILVNAQSAASDNGVYTFNGTGSAMTRATGWTAASDHTAGRTVWVREGTNRSRMLWTIQFSVTTLGTDPVNWSNTGSDSQLLPNLNNIFVPRTLGGTNLGSLSNAFGNIYGYGPGGIWLTDGTQVHRWAMSIAGSGSNGAPPYSGTQDLIFTNRTQSLNFVSLNSNGTNATAGLSMRTGHQVGGAAATGDLNFITGNHAGSGPSGSITLGIGTVAGGTRGKIKFTDGSEGTAGYVWTSTDTAGSGAWLPASAPVVTPTIEYRTLTSGEASANALTLTGTPSDPTKVVADIFSGGGPMEYTAEFMVTGTTFDWSGGVYAGVLVAGDRIRIMYWT